MKWLMPVFGAAYGSVALLFGVAGVSLIVFAAIDLARSMGSASPAGIVAALGTLAVALVALEVAQTVTEEEVIRKAHVSAPTRVRRYLSRFLVVVVVALSIETLVAVMTFIHESPADLPRAGSIAFAAAALLVAWGAFIWFNRAAEELEPEAMREAKKEDRKVG
jgi:drug/metabolite transporter (DMT)-like permease